MQQGRWRSLVKRRQSSTSCAPAPLLPKGAAAAAAAHLGQRLPGQPALLKEHDGILCGEGGRGGGVRSWARARRHRCIWHHQPTHRVGYVAGSFARARLPASQHSASRTPACHQHHRQHPPFPSRARPGPRPPAGTTGRTRPRSWRPYRPMRAGAQPLTPWRAPGPCAAPSDPCPSSGPAPHGKVATISAQERRALARTERPLSWLAWGDARMHARMHTPHDHLPYTLPPLCALAPLTRLPTARAHVHTHAVRTRAQTPPTCTTCTTSHAPTGSWSRCRCGCPPPSAPRWPCARRNGRRGSPSTQPPAGPG